MSLPVLLPVCAIGVLAGGRLVERLSRERLLSVIAAVLTVSGALLLARVVASLTSGCSVRAPMSSTIIRCRMLRAAVRSL